MKYTTFCTFWDAWTKEWLNSEIETDKATVKVKDLCSIRWDAGFKVHHNYCEIKKLVKKLYFKDPKSEKLSRYKRGAVLIYAIIKADVLSLKGEQKKRLDKHLLKERLAFYVAIGSILQDYDKQDVLAKRPLQRLKDLGERDRQNDADDILTSIYKDIFYANIYKNYNIMTVSNMLYLYFKCDPVLSTLKKRNQKA